MSLKVVHIVVILLSIGITLFFGFWALREYRVMHDFTILCWGAASLIGGFVLIPYLIWFLFKARRTGLK